MRNAPPTSKVDLHPSSNKNREKGKAINEEFFASALFSSMCPDQIGWFRQFRHPKREKTCPSFKDC